MKTKIIMMAAASVIAFSGVASADSNSSFLSDAPYYRGGTDASTTHPIRDLERRYDRRVDDRYYHGKKYKKETMKHRMDRYEDKLDRQEDKFDRAEDRWDAKHGKGGKLDRWEDRRDAREDIRDAKH